MSGTPTTPAAESLPPDRESGKLTPATPKKPLHDNRPLPRPFDSQEELPKKNLYPQFREAPPTKSSPDHETPDLSRQMLSAPSDSVVATLDIPVDSTSDGEDSTTGSTNPEAALALANDPETQQICRTLFE